MKKLLLLLTIATFAAFTSASAQDHANVKHDKSGWEQKVKDELKLTADQTEKFDAIGKEYKDKIDALQSDANLDKGARHEKKMALKKEKEAKLLELLTPEQQTRFKELMEKKKKEKREKAEY